jgi:hypothetical protein
MLERGVVAGVAAALLLAGPVLAQGNGKNAKSATPSPAASQGTPAPAKPLPPLPPIDKFKGNCGNGKGAGSAAGAGLGRGAGNTCARDLRAPPVSPG